jgi:hypothetical protein
MNVTILPLPHVFSWCFWTSSEFILTSTFWKLVIDFSSNEHDRKKIRNSKTAINLGDAQSPK